LPEYSVPGVYVDAVPSAGARIPLASTDTSLFLGPMPTFNDSRGPCLHSWADFAAAHGEVATLYTMGNGMPHHLAAAAWAFFKNGGRKLHVAPVAHAPGSQPVAAAYADALSRSKVLDDVAIVAAPGASGMEDGENIVDALLQHVHETDCARFLVLEPPPGQDLFEVRRWRARVHSPHAALYYPWVMTAPAWAGEAAGSAPVAVAPSGFVCGVYARTEMAVGVHKAPANQVLVGAHALEHSLKSAEQNLLNPEGINVLRRFEGREIRLWGARTLGDDPDGKYVQVRRLVDQIKRSLQRGIGWVAFEGHGERVYTRVVHQIEAFLQQRWHSGALVGSKPEQAFFVRCDRSTMSAEDIAQGRLVCLVGLAVSRPAEFVVLRIVQETATPTG